MSKLEFSDEQFLVFCTLFKNVAPGSPECAKEDCFIFPLYDGAFERIQHETVFVYVIGTSCEINVFEELCPHEDYFIVRVFLQPSSDYSHGRIFYVVIAEEIRSSVIINLRESNPDHAIAYQMPAASPLSEIPRSSRSSDSDKPGLPVAVWCSMEELFVMLKNNMGSTFDRIVTCLLHCFDHLVVPMTLTFNIVPFPEWLTMIKVSSPKIPDLLNYQDFRRFFCLLAAHCFMPALIGQSRRKQHITKKIMAAWYLLNKHEINENDMSRYLEFVSFNPGEKGDLLDELCGRALTTNLDQVWNPCMSSDEVDKMSQGSELVTKCAYKAAIFEQFKIIHKFRNMNPLRFAVEGYLVLKETHLDQDDFFAEEIDYLKDWERLIKTSPFLGLRMQQPVTLQANKAPKACYFGVLHHGNNLSSSHDSSSWRSSYKDSFRKNLKHPEHKDVIESKFGSIPKNAERSKRIVAQLCTEKSYSFFHKSWSQEELDYVYFVLNQTHPGGAFSKMRARELNLNAINQFMAETKPLIDLGFIMAFSKVSDKINLMTDKRQKHISRRQLEAQETKVERALATDAGNFIFVLDSIGMSSVTNLDHYTDLINDWYGKIASWSDQEISEGTFAL